MQLSKAIREAYFTSLNGVIMNGLNPVPVFDSFALPENTAYPYILLSTQNNVQRGLKRCRFWDCDVLVDIVTGDINPIGRDTGEEIAEQVENIINPYSYTDLTLNGGYVIGNTILNGDTDLESKNDTHYVYRKLLTFNHLISK